MLLPAVVGPLLAFSAVWLPLLLQYRMPTPGISDAAIAQMRRLPDDRVFLELQNMKYGVRRIADREQLLATAEQLSEGILSLPGFAPLGISREIRPVDLTVGPPTVQLQMASMLVPDVLLQAYELTGERDYFVSARQATLAWARMEAAARLPVGLLWNDHAVASRILYLARFWRYFRDDPDFNVEEARVILGLVARSAGHLAHRTEYNYRTNHGIMQNLGLLHVAAAFPGLPGSRAYLNLAIKRLRMHMPYYVSDSGIVLEHSATYQEFGIELLEDLSRYLGLLHIKLPGAWRAQADHAFCFLRHIVRPDRSVPFYGDSYGLLTIPSVRNVLFTGDVRIDRAHCSPDRLFLDEDFGYASFRHVVPGRGKAALLSHTFSTWANFIGGSHKHADELSISAWFDGQDWWAGSGYWPFGDRDRQAAVSWRGSNAPHRRGEPFDSVRTSTLRGHAAADSIFFLDLERTAGPDTVRRQLVFMPPATWIVLDSRAGGESDFDILWTTAPAVEVGPATEAGIYRLSSKRVPAQLDVAFFGKVDATISPVKGRREPFMGMVVNKRKIEVEDVFAVRLPPQSWVGTAWVGRRNAARTGISGKPAMDWRSGSDWRLLLPLDQGEVRVTRAGDSLTVQAADGTSDTTTLIPGHIELPALKAATGKYLFAAASFKRFHDYFPEREKVTYLLLILTVTGWVLLWAARRRFDKIMPVLAGLGFAGWAGCALWLNWVYLA